MTDSSNAASAEIDARMLSLDEWLQAMRNPEQRQVLSITWEFPTEEHRKGYLETIGSRSTDEVSLLLQHFLLPGGSLRSDVLNWQVLVAAERDAPELARGMMETGYYRWLRQSVAGEINGPWEGITWVRDLLPHYPKEALQALGAYTLAHVQFLPDGRLNGLLEAAELIRAKFIGTPESLGDRVAALLNIAPREFEHLVECLYGAMGYTTELTPATRDGGRDVIASKDEPGSRQRLYVECKQYSDPVAVEFTRALIGVVGVDHATKGVVVTTSDFTADARKFAAKTDQIELITGVELVQMLNEHLGAEWPLQIDTLVARSRARYERSRTGDAETA
jgi:restriction system protein